MDQKAKIIVAVLAVIIVSLFGVVMVTFDAKQKLEGDNKSLSQTNEGLKSKLDAAQSDRQRMTEQLDRVSRQLSQAQDDKADIEKRFADSERAKGDLINAIEKLKSQKAAAPVAAAPVPNEYMSPMGGSGLSQGNDAYWAGVLKAKTNIELQLETIKVELQNAKISSEQAQREKAALQIEVGNVGREKDDLRRQLDYNQKMMDSVAQELVREKNDKLTIQNQVKPLKNENIVLRRQMEALNNRKVDLERKLSEVQAKNSELDGRFNEMDTFLKGKINELDILKKQLTDGPIAQSATNSRDSGDAVELPPIVVRPSASQGQPALHRNQDLSGKVLTLNPDNNFVVIDLGEEAGVGVGDTFQVTRDGESIGTIEAMQVRKSISACDIKKQTTPIKIGDTVK